MVNVVAVVSDAEAVASRQLFVVDSIVGVDYVVIFSLWVFDELPIVASLLPVGRVKSDELHLAAAVVLYPIEEHRQPVDDTLQLLLRRVPANSATVNLQVLDNFRVRQHAFFAVEELSGEQAKHLLRQFDLQWLEAFLKQSPFIDFVSLLEVLLSLDIGKRVLV